MNYKITLDNDQVTGLGGVSVDIPYSELGLVGGQILMPIGISAVQNDNGGAAVESFTGNLQVTNSSNEAMFTFDIGWWFSPNLLQEGAQPAELVYLPTETNVPSEVLKISATDTVDGGNPNLTLDIYLIYVIINK